METITLTYHGEGKGDELNSLIQELNGSMPGYQTRPSGVAAEVPDLIEAARVTVETIKFVAISVPWDWSIIGGLFGGGVLAGAGQEIGKSSVQAAKHCFAKVVDWMRKHPENLDTTNGTRVTVRIQHNEIGHIANLEVDIATQNDPVITKVNETQTD